MFKQMKINETSLLENYFDLEFSEPCPFEIYCYDKMPVVTKHVNTLHYILYCICRGMGAK